MTTYDCIVIGGGPAGSTTATVLARHGRRVSVLERSRFPRHHIGESLMPHTYHAFERLGVLDALKRSDYPRKESVQFVSASGMESQPYYFTDRDPREHSVTWQVRRDEFDQMMLDHARAAGADVREEVHVKEVLFDGDRATGVRAQADGAVIDWHAKVVVDASGTAALLSKQLKIRQADALLRNAALYGYYENAVRDEGRNAGATLIIHTPDRRGWFWFIPISRNVTSIGLVGLPSRLCAGRGADPASTFEQEIQHCPGLERRLRDARRVGRVHVLSDFSYSSSRIAGPGWVLVGDAFGFLDPVYSSGVMLALKSGELAADAIHQALEAGDLSGDRLGAFGPRFVAGMSLLKKLVYAFYDPEFSFGRFIQRHPEHNDRLVRLLIGDVFNDEVGAIFDDMRNWVSLPDSIRLNDAPTPPPIAAR